MKWILLALIVGAVGFVAYRVMHVDTPGPVTSSVPGSVSPPTTGGGLIDQVNKTITDVNRTVELGQELWGKVSSW